LDDRISLKTVAKEFGGSPVVLKKRHFPFPVKIFGIDQKQVKKNIIECFSSVGMLIGGGKEFIIRVGKTESMKRRHIIGNV
jgi:hypothetical protein